MKRRIAATLTLSLFALGAGPTPAHPGAPLPDLHWRFVGPLRGGRTAAVAGVANEPDVFYIGAVNGGIWRTDDAGRTWAPIFDAQDTGSIGALAIAPSDPNVIYAGSGEGLQRPDLTVGNGIYASTDGGRTWTHRGLRTAEQIPAIAVDPKNPQRLFVAALGHPYGPNAQRGVFRSTDGGATFERVLYVDENTGAFDVVIDPNDSNVVYATMWAGRQSPWETPEGDSFQIPGISIYKSTDGGTTWAPLRNGLPVRSGRAEIAIAQSNSNIVYAYVDVPHEGAGIYRSDDAGAHFVEVNHEPQLAKRGDDLASLGVDPQNPDIVYATNTSTYRSNDGGRTWVAIKGAPGGDDYHAIWINPALPSHMIVVSDQGAAISLNGGRTWSSWYNQPTAQMYHVGADDRFPYWICGGQQESGSACVASRGNWGEVTERDWHPVGAEEYGYVVADPLHPGIFYGGKVEKFDEHTGQTQEVSPLALQSKAFREIRTEPLAFDPLHPQRLYFAANVVFATQDGGQSWQGISPDLTRVHPGVPAVLGPFERDDPEHGMHRGVVYALAPSYVHEGTIWAGTDDGYVWITRDGGAHWRNVTPPGLTPWSKISQIDASRFDDRTAYVSVNRIRLDDLRPYVYRTHDGGAHWQLVVNGLPRWPINAVREDPVQRGLLYAGTEDGVAVSFDDGARWQSLQLNLPHTSVRDLIVHDGDLIVATHGRGFWILDDVEPLREIAADALRGPIHLFSPRTAYRVRRDTNTDTPLPPEEPSGENPPNGAIVDYALASPARLVTLEILDRSGRVVRRYTSDDRPPPRIPNLDKPVQWEKPFVRLSGDAGMHRFVWDLREAPPRVSAADQDLPISAVWHATPRVPQGALLPPGRYTVRLDVDGRTTSRPLAVLMDPRVRISAAALQEQYAIAHGITTLLDELYGKPHVERLLFGLATLLQTVDGSDTPVTAQAKAAYAALRAQVPPR
jgi:photosystem II stability/assembly factor-like uncharacterized protein